MKKLQGLFLLGMVFLCKANAANLMQVYQDALAHDPTYLSAKATYDSALADVSIARSALLPQVSVSNYTAYSGKSQLETNSAGVGGNSHIQGTALQLDANQVLFNGATFMQFVEAKSAEKAAAATFYGAKQDLMARVVDAYFSVLKDDEKITYTQAQIKAYKRALDQAQQKFKVGTKTLTDVYSAKAEYSSAVADNVSAVNAREIDLENVYAITSMHYKMLNGWGEHFAIVPPNPKSINAWTRTTENNNWLLKAKHFEVLEAQQKIKEAFSGHLPTVNAVGEYSNTYSVTSGGSSSPNSIGRQRLKILQAKLWVTMPIYSGGGVVAGVDKARHDYVYASQQQELTHRTVVNEARQAYLNVLASISQMQADKDAVKSGEQALKGLEEGYKVGTETMVDVLNSQQSLFSDQSRYADDRFTYVTNLIALKEEAGTLSENDLMQVNRWLKK